MHTSENNYIITEQDLLGMAALINRLQFFLDLLPANKTIQTNSSVLADTIDDIKGEIETIHENVYSRFTSPRRQR